MGCRRDMTFHKLDSHNMKHTSTGTNGVSSLASGDVDLNVRNAPSLRFGKCLDPLVDICKGAAVGFGQTIEGLLAVLSRHGVRAGVVGGNVPETLGDLQELGSVDSTIWRRPQLGDDVLCLPEGGGINWVLDLHGHVGGRHR